MCDRVIRLYHIINLLAHYPNKKMTLLLLKSKLRDKGYEVCLPNLRRDMLVIMLYQI